MKNSWVYKQIRGFFSRNFDVRQEKENEQETIESIKKVLNSKELIFGFSFLRF